MFPAAQTDQKKLKVGFVGLEAGGSESRDGALLIAGVCVCVCVCACVCVCVCVCLFPCCIRN